MESNQTNKKDTFSKHELHLKSNPKHYFNSYKLYPFHNHYMYSYTIYSDFLVTNPDKSWMTIPEMAADIMVATNPQNKDENMVFEISADLLPLLKVFNTPKVIPKDPRLANPQRA